MFRSLDHSFLVRILGILSFLHACVSLILFIQFHSIPFNFIDSIPFHFMSVHFISFIHSCQSCLFSALHPGFTKYYKAARSRAKNKTTWPTTHRSATLAVLFAARADLVSWRPSGRKQSKSNPVAPSASAIKEFLVQYRLLMHTMHTH